MFTLIFLKIVLTIDLVPLNRRLIKYTKIKQYKHNILSRSIVMMTRQLKIIDSVNPKIIHLPIILVLFPSKLFNKEYYGFIQSKPESKIK